MKSYRTRPYILLFIETLIVFYVVNANVGLNTLAVSALIVAAISILSLLKSGYHWFSLPTVFLFFTYVFHCTQFLFNIFIEDYYKYFDIVGLTGDNISIQILEYSIVAILFLTYGFVISSNASLKPLPTIGNSNYNYGKCGKTLLIICILPRVIIDVVFFLVGYENSESVDIPGFIRIWAEGFYIGIALILIGCKNRPAYCKKVFILATIYVLFTMLSGRRQIALTYWIMLALIYFRYVYVSSKKYTLTTKLIYAFLAFLGIVFIATIGDTRNHASSFSEVFSSNMSLMVVADQIGEFGGTGISLGYAIMSFPSQHGFNYGLTYLESFIMLLPNVGGWLDEINRGTDYIYMLPSDSQLALGGSYLGELYYNFGMIGKYFTIIIGYYLGLLTRIMDRGIKYRMSFTVILCILAISPTLLWVRGVFSYFVRTCVYLGVLIYIILKNQKKNVKVNN